MKRIRKIEATLPTTPRRKRVAAYARISEEKGRTMHSLAAQVSYYSELIQSRSEWEYAGVYADSGISGTTDTRKEFQRLLADCDDGKIDIILTKSTVDLHAILWICSIPFGIYGSAALRCDSRKNVFIPCLRMGNSC